MRYYHFTHVYHKWQSYDLRKNENFSPKNENFKKMKKKPGDFIILHTCTKNYDYMIYGSWDMVRDGRMDGRTDGKSGT